MKENTKISVNKLGEYLESNPSRRKKIVFDQKNPAAFITTRYSRARNIAIEYFMNYYDEEIIINGIDTIENLPTGTDFQNSDNQKSIEYLERLLDINLPNLEDFTISKYEGENPKLNMNNVDISVNPDLIIRGTIRGQSSVGAIKFHFSQSNPLNNESAKNVATVLHRFVEEHIASTSERTDVNLCMSLDVFADTVQTAPRSYLRRRAHIADACAEIGMWWNSL